jgi:hypothetical protein
MRSISRAFCISALLLAAGCRYYEVREPDPLTTQEILEMSRSGATPEEIIHKIDASGTVYIMDSKDVIDLDESGVDPKVIDHMLDTHRRDVERRYYRHYHCHPWYPYYRFGWYWY